MKNKRLKAYFWMCDRDAECGLAIIAYNAKEAKRLGYAYWGSDVGHEAPDSFIEQRCTLIKGNVNIKGIRIPSIISSGLEGLKRGLYGWVEDNCEECGVYGTLTNVINGKCVCNSCEDKLSASSSLAQKTTESDKSAKKS